jgi:membrane associated rhomboid family serine protease
LLIPISTEHAEKRHQPIANLAIIALTSLVSLVLMHRLDDAMLASFIAHGDPSKLDGWIRHLPLVRGSADLLQLVGHTLLHADGWHLLGNMLLLLALGNSVNARIGQLRYVALYVVSGAVAATAWLLFGGDARLMIGASGAISGVVGAFLVLFPLTRVNVIFWLTGLVALLFAGALSLIMGRQSLPLLEGTGLAVIVVTIFALRSLAEQSPPEGALLRALGFWSFPLSGFWVVLWFVGWDVAAVVGKVGGRVAHEAHLGGVAGGMTIAAGLALAGFVRGTRDDPTLPELVGLVPPRAEPARTPTFTALMPPTRRYNQALTFSDYRRQRLSPEV